MTVDGAVQRRQHEPRYLRSAVCHHAQYELGSI